MSEESQPEVLIPEIKLQSRVREIAAKINSEFAGEELTVVCILKGSFVFFADLIREIDLPMSCEFLGLSSYGSKQTSSGEVKLTLDINEPLEGKNVLVVEDIVDTGLTLQYIIRNLAARGPKSLKICSLLFKPESLKSDVKVDYVGFEIGNEFVVGYGVDYAEKYRGLPYIGFIKNEH